MDRIKSFFLAVYVVIVGSCATTSYAMHGWELYMTPEQPMPSILAISDVRNALLGLRLKAHDDVAALSMKELMGEVRKIGRNAINEAYAEESFFPNQLQFFSEEPYVALNRDILLRVFYEDAMGVKSGRNLTLKIVNKYLNGLDDLDEEVIEEMRNECERIIQKQQRRSSRLAKSH